MLLIVEKDLENAVGEKRHTYHRDEKCHVLDEQAVAGFGGRSTSLNRVVLPGTGGDRGTFGGAGMGEEIAPSQA